MMVLAGKAAKCLVSFSKWLFPFKKKLFSTFRILLSDFNGRCSYFSLSHPFLLDENECKYRPCDVFAHCTNTMGSFYCSCFPGYEGDGFECHGKFPSGFPWILTIFIWNSLLSLFGDRMRFQDLDYFRQDWFHLVYNFCYKQGI